MTLPPLYLEGLTQRALLGQEQLEAYKLGLIEAILKEALRSEHGQDVAALRSAVQDAVEVAQWEMRSPRGIGTNREGLP
ncbi:MAG: hypothetical protein M3N28_03970 [Actinomycetota bacterium]|nr:hypothetical protein [Actinomycetota bacterium]